MVDYLIPLLSSLVAGLVAVIIARKETENEVRLAEDRLRREHQTAYSVETAIQELMSRGFRLRSFSLIRHHIRGLDDNELRQHLLGAGCICFRVIKKVEYWGLLAGNEDLLPNRDELQQAGMTFYE